MEEERVEGVEERVGPEAEEVGDELEEVEGDVEVVAVPEASPPSVASEARGWWTLPGDLGVLERLARSWGRYGTCLVELREWLREKRLLYPELARDIARELRYVRAHLYAIGARAAALVDGDCSRLGSALLRRLCEYAANGVPRYVWQVITRSTGAKRPDIILHWLCRYRRECCPSTA